MNQMNNNKNKGFSLVELIVVIAIMAVMVAVLAPSLLQYVERSRAQKDDSAMGEVANAIMLGMSDQKIYDEVLFWTTKDNVSCYADSSCEADAINTALAVEDKNLGNQAGTVEAEDNWSYTDDARLADEEAYHFDGKMRGITITFQPEGNSSVYVMANGVINAGARNKTYYGGGNLAENDKYTLGMLEANKTLNAGTHHYLYNRVRATVGDTITLTSQTYRKSNYTVFIRMGTTGGNSAAGQDAVKVYGQWNGTNLG